LKAKFELSVIKPSKQKEQERMNSLPRLVCFLLLSVSALAAQPPITVPELLAEADAMYWFAQAEGGDMKMLGQGLGALDRADALMAAAPADVERDKLMAASAALRTELTEQEIMAHDTVNGTLPLFRYFLFRDRVSEWVDDPVVIVAVRGARAVAATASTYWKPHPQLDVVYGSQGWDHSGEGRGMVASPTQENEMAYVFNLDGRFFNHHRGELAATMDSGQMASYESSGLDGATAMTLSRAWGIDRLLEVRIKELFVEDPWWFYVVTAKLFSASDGATEASVNSFAMVRDQSAKTPWLALVLLPLVGALLWSVFFLRRLWAQSLAAWCLALPASVAFVVAVGPWIPPGDWLLTISWWAPAGVALALLLVLPALLYAVAWRFPQLASWLFGSEAKSTATGLGVGAGVASLGAFAALTELPPDQAAALTALALPAFGCVPARLFAHLRGTEGRRWPEILLALAAAAWFAWIFATIPPDDRSNASLITAGLPLAASLAAALGLAFSRHAAIGALAMFALGGFGAMMTGHILPLAIFAIAGVICLAARQTQTRRASVEVRRDSSDAKADWHEVFANPRDRWPLAQVAPLGEVRQALEHARNDAIDGHVQVLAVCGEAGTGKTRMVGESATAGGWRLFQGCCRSGEAFSFLQEAAQRAGAGRLAALGGEEGKAAMEIGAKLISSVPVLGTLCDWIAPGGQQNASPEMLASEFLALMEAADRSGTQPPLLWIDDAENLTPDGVALVKALADNARTRKRSLVIVLCGRRIPSQFAAARSLDIGWSESDRLQALESVLSPDSARSLVKASPGLVPGSYIAWVQHLWHRESLVEDAGKLRIKNEDGNALEVPASVVEAAGKALEGLDSAVFEALQAAAVDGTRFHISAVAKATGMATYDLLRRLEEAEQWGLVEDLPEDEVFAFRAAPVREYLVGTLYDDRKASFRQRYISWNRGLSEAYLVFGIDSFLPEAALHAREAGPSYLRQAVEICLRAADYCLAAGQWETAAGYAAFVVEHGDKSQAVRAGTIFLKAQWLLRADPAQPQLAPVITQLRKLVEETGASEDERALLACELTRTFWPSAWNPNSADDKVAQLLDSVHPQSEAARIRTAHFKAATLHKFCGKESPGRRQAFEQLRKSVELPAEDSAAKQEKAEALNTLTEVAMQLGEENDVLPALEQSIAFKKESGDRMGLAISYGTLGRFHLFRPSRSRDDLEKAISAFEEDLRISLEIGDTSGQITMNSLLGLCYLESGDAQKALVFAKQSHDAAAALGQKRNAAFAMCGMVRAMAASGAADLQGEVDRLHEFVATLGDHDREALKHALEKVRESCKAAEAK
jgi:tetratricopeptide (TPR) repeat protein